MSLHGNIEVSRFFPSVLEFSRRHPFDKQEEIHLQLLSHRHLGLELVRREKMNTVV